MYKSIQEFVEKGTQELEKSSQEFYEELNLDEWIKEIEDQVLQLGRNLIRETLENLNELLRTSPDRKENWHIEHKSDVRSIVTSLGNVTYQRSLFMHKKTKERVYGVDEAIGLQKHVKVTREVKAKILEEATESSYRKGGEVLGFEKLSKTAVKDWIHELEIKVPVPEPTEKKQKKQLYIFADEDHVSQQSSDPNTSGIFMPKLIVVAEGRERENLRNKRYRLLGKRVFGGLASGVQSTEELWDEVYRYIALTYDESVLEQVYINGDGASWIKKGLDVIEKSIFVLDKFHLSQSIHRSVSHLQEGQENMKNMLWEAVKKGDQQELHHLLDIVVEVTESSSKQEQIKSVQKYLRNQWKGIVNHNRYQKKLIGCCAEGQVSHILSSRLSSRPLSWSRTGVDQMSKLCVYKANGGKIYDLLAMQEKNQQQQQQIEKQNQWARRVRQESGAQQYADVFTKMIPGIERRQMHWLRDLTKHNYRISG